MSKTSLFLLIMVMAVLILTACEGETKPAIVDEPASIIETEVEDIVSESSEENTEEEESNMITLTIGDYTIHAELADTAAARELRELLKKGSVTMSASNYGGFEKVCSLGHRLTAEDVQTTTQAGDIMLYSGNQVVIFYGSNRWAYTRLGWVVEDEITELDTILSGSETEVLLSLG